MVNCVFSSLSIAIFSLLFTTTPTNIVSERTQNQILFQQHPKADLYPFDSLLHFREQIDLAISFARNDDFEMAKEVFQSIEPLCQALEYKLPEEDFFRFWYESGRIERSLNRPDLALKRHRRCLHFLETKASEALRIKHLRKIYYYLSLSYRNCDEPDSAYIFAQKTLDCLPDSPTGSDTFYIFRALNLTGNLYSDKGDFEKSNTYFHSALSISPNAGASDATIGIIKSNLGNNALEMGQLDEAIHLFQDALNLRRDDPKLPRRELFQDFNLLIRAKSEKFGWDTAFALIEEFQTLIKPQFDSLSASDRIEYLRLIGLFHWNAGRDDVAEKMFEQAFDSVKTLSYPNISAVNLIGELADFYLKKNKPENSLSTCLYGLDFIKNEDGRTRSFSFETQLRAIAGLARIEIFSKSKDPQLLQLAARDFREALDFLTLKNMPTRPATALEFDFRQSDLPTVERVMEGYLRLKKVTGDDAYLHEAFQTVERFKAIELRVNLRRDQARQFANIPAQVIERERDMSKRLNFLKRNLEMLEKGSPEAAELQAEAITLEKALEAHLKMVKDQYRNYYDLLYSTEVDPVPNVCAGLKNDQSLLEFFVGTDKIFTFVLNPDGSCFHREIDAGEGFEKLIEDFRKGLFDSFTQNPSDANEELCLSLFLDAAPKLYDTLIRPLEPLLRKRVIIIPDGYLGYVPFAALLTKRPPPESEPFFGTYDYWVKQKSISYNHSAALLREMREKRYDARSRLPFAGFAPFVKKTLVAGNQLVVDGKAVEQLPFSGDEIRTGQRQFGGEVNVGKAASLAHFKNICSRTAVLHLSTHASANDRAGDYSYLLFAGGEKLHVHEIYERSIPADLVLLTGCATGFGPLKRAEGAISLARAFSFVGARSIVSTLWPVTNGQTSAVTGFFYKQFGMGASLGMAVSEAQRQYLATNPGLGGHPFFWAGIIPVGGE